MSNQQILTIDGTTRGKTTNNLVYNTITETFQCQTAEADFVGLDLINKYYADLYIAGYQAGTALTADGDFFIYNLGFDSWDKVNVYTDAIFNASKINNVAVGDLSGIFDKQALLYDFDTFSFLPHYVITDLSSPGAAQSLIYSSTSEGSIVLYDIESSDSTVDITTDGNMIDFKVAIPDIDLENTADVTSFYTLSNPGINQSTYTFKGLNTLTSGFIGFNQDSNNVYIDAQNIVGKIAYSNGTTVNVNQTNAVMGTFTIPANTLANNGQSVRYRMNGTYVCSAGDIILKANFGGQLLSTLPGALGSSGLIGNSGSSFVLEFIVNRNAVGNLNGYLKLEFSDGSSLTTNQFRWCNSFTASAINYAINNTMSVTVTTGATGIITWQGAHVEIMGN